jgi:hypothetical protein
VTSKGNSTAQRPQESGKKWQTNWQTLPAVLQFPRKNDGFHFRVKGLQYRVPLDTEEEGEAITKALRTRANPLLAGAEPLSDEIKGYLEAKQDDGTYTRNSADSRGPVLNRWVRERRLSEVPGRRNVSQWGTAWALFDLPGEKAGSRPLPL